MLSYLIRRLLMALFTILAISILSFLIIKLPPGDYVTSYVAQMSASGSAVSEEAAANLRAEYGLDQPVYIQYLRWARLALQGNFGQSMEYRQPVLTVIGERIWTTMIVAVAALLFTWAVALPIGIYSAIRQYSFFDYLFSFVGFIGLAVPNFLLGLLVLYFGFKYLNLNVGGLFSPEYVDAPWSWGRVGDMLAHLPVPMVILGLASTAQQIRIMRANLLDEKRKPYVVTARAKGLPEYRVILKYPVRVALNPFASTIGYTLPFIVSGAIILSLVLGLPTVGPVLLKSLVAMDMFLAATIIMMTSVLTVIGTLISDLLLVWIDPRIRLQSR